MSDGPEYVGGSHSVRDVGVEVFDQGHAEALERLRAAEQFVLLTPMPVPEGLIGVQYKLLIRGEAENRDVRLAFAATLEQLAQAIREEEGA